MNPLNDLQEHGQAVRLDLVPGGFRLRQDNAFAEKILSAIRKGFGTRLK